MTSTTTTAPETVEMVGLPTTVEEWAEAWRSEFTWGTVEPNEVARWALENASVLSAETLPSDTVIIDSFSAANTRYRRGNGQISADDERVLTWVKQMASRASTPKPNVGKTTPEMIVEAMFPTNGEHDWIQVAMGINDSTRRERIRTTVIYQVGNWLRGVYTVKDFRKAREQFVRRMDREYGWYPSSSASERLLNTAFKRILDFIKGDITDLAPAMMNQDRIESFITTHLPNFLQGTGNAHYYTSAHIQSTMSRKHERNEFEWPDDYPKNLAEYLKGCVSWPGHSDEEWQREMEEVIALMEPFVTAAVSDAGDVQVDETLNDLDSLIAWQMALHPKVSEFQQKAIEHAARDFVDYARFPGFKEGTNYVTTFRRMVGQYGFMKFTGKERRSVMEKALAQVVEAVKDQPITDEEWKARYIRRDLAVSYVSGRYGEQNSLCKVLEQATGELGIEPVRKPKHKVRFEGSGVLAEVEVETWYDDENVLRDSARSTWERMNEQQRQAAIIEHVKPFIHWADMKMAR